MIRQIRVKYAGKCSCCGGTIARGSLANWDASSRSLSHDSESVACAARMKAAWRPDASDMAYEDQCSAACGLDNEDR